MNIELFLKNYSKEFINISKIDKDVLNKIKKLFDLILKIKKKNKKIIIVGNGGSAAIASHFSVDMTKNGGVRCVNFNESDLLTCFANDYGYENWVSKSIQFYGDEGDVVVLISSSGSSQNMINAAKKAKKMKIKVITFTGFEKNNLLKSVGDCNIWVDSRAYNIVEMTHHIWLLAIVDLIIGKSEYSA